MSSIHVAYVPRAGEGSDPVSRGAVIRTCRDEPGHPRLNSHRARGTTRVRCTWASSPTHGPARSGARASSRSGSWCPRRAARSRRNRRGEVITCPNCGEENPDRFRLCGFCGAPLAAPLPAQEVRKTVTIVFSDLEGSTALGERLDSEALREVMSRYFEEMRGALELHGGTVEKYIGDAI